MRMTKSLPVICYITGKFRASLIHMKNGGIRKTQKFASILYVSAKKEVLVDVIFPVVFLWNGRDRKFSYVFAFLHSCESKSWTVAIPTKFPNSKTETVSQLSKCLISTLCFLTDQCKSSIFTQCASTLFEEE